MACVVLIGRALFQGVVLGSLRAQWLPLRQADRCVDDRCVDDRCVDDRCVDDRCVDDRCVDDLYVWLFVCWAHVHLLVR